MNLKPLKFCVGMGMAAFSFSFGFMEAFAQGSTGRNSPRACSKIKESQFRTDVILTQGVLVDDFGPVQNDELSARLDNFVAALNNNLNDLGIIVVYGNVKDIARQFAGIRKYVAFRKFDSARIELVREVSASHVITKFYRFPLPSAEDAFK